MLSFLTVYFADFKVSTIFLHSSSDIKLLTANIPSSMFLIFSFNFIFDFSLE